MARRISSSALLALLVGLALVKPPTADAGGYLQVLDITGRRPNPDRPGELLATARDVRWSSRCLPIGLRVNDTIDPIPNPLGPPVLTLAQAIATFDQALAVWRQIPTSYFDANRLGTVTNPGPAGFDMVNELTFNTNPFTIDENGDGTADRRDFFAWTAIIALIEDSHLVVGQDLDRDGDSDVAAGLTQCRDADGDGDFELPPGFYPAGTLLDADVSFNTNFSRFTVGDAAVDTFQQSVDLLAVATHELGHVQGLGHALDNQTGNLDGTGPTMHARIGATDPLDEISFRSLHPDDVAWSSNAYPEGTASQGLPALQRGDVAFDKAFGYLTGEAFHGEQKLPLAGANVSARDTRSGELVGSTYTGSVRLSYDPVRQERLFLDPAQGILDGEWRLPLPPGRYELTLEPTDGSPIGADSVSLVAEVGAAAGQVGFFEEQHDGKDETDLEVKPAEPEVFRVQKGRTTRTPPFLTNLLVAVGNSAPAQVSNVSSLAQRGSRYAVRIPRQALLDASSEALLLFQGAEFLMVPTAASEAPVFAEILLTRGRVEPNSVPVIDLAQPLVRKRLLVGQERDWSFLAFDDAWDLSLEIAKGLYEGTIEDLFLVLQVPTIAPRENPSGRLSLVGSVPERDELRQTSYIAFDGVSFTRRTADNFLFRLVAVPLH